MPIVIQVCLASIIGGGIGAYVARSEERRQILIETVSSAFVGLAGAGIAFSFVLIITQNSYWFLNLSGAALLPLISLRIFKRDLRARKRIIDFPLIMFSGFFASALLALLGNNYFLHKGYIAGIINLVNGMLYTTPAGILLINGIIGLALFGVRERLRDVYSIIELLFGAVAASLSLISLVKTFKEGAADHDLELKLVTIVIGFLSGIYVLVRGFDNAEKSLEADWKDATEKLKVSSGDPKAEVRKNRLHQFMLWVAGKQKVSIKSLMLDWLRRT